jgi:hydrogenase expression/formation protein HypE
MSSDGTGPRPWFECPVPLSGSDTILLGHGGGGKMSARLVEEMILPALRNDALAALDDQAVLELGGPRIAFTTDSYVVTPLFFPGGDIGELAVNGTVNDLAVGGAIPRALSLAFILEEGLPLDEFRRVLDAVARAAKRAEVPVVTGDTKVVGRGCADRLFVNTAGIGVVRPGVSLGSSRVQPGDAVLVSGTVGDHGVAILSTREGLAFDGAIASDTAPLHGLVQSLLDAAPGVHAMRDPTRGGLAATLVEIASRRRLGIDVDETTIPVSPGVRGACEMLGLDPLMVANEGKLVAFVPEDHADAALEAMRGHPLGRSAARIGRVTDDHPGRVVLRTSIGGRRVLDLPLGEALPRIC